MSRIRVFIACSLDGFIAGPKDELDWLPSDHEGIEDTFTPFLAQIGALLMGRRTFDVCCGFAEWPYGETPVLVATARPLRSTRPTVEPVGGAIEEIVEVARARAGGRDVYLDGGALIRSALDARLIDEITVTSIPLILGRGLPLFAGVTQRHGLDFVEHRHIGGGLVQTTYRPRHGD